MYRINNNPNAGIPEGFRNLTDDEVAKAFLHLDSDKSYTITKNEWMLNCLKLLAEDVKSLDAESPDAIMDKFKELSDEFDRYDLDGNKVIDYIEYRNFLMNNMLISEE